LDFRTRQRVSGLALLAGVAVALVPTALLADRFDARRRGEAPERVLYLPRGQSLNHMCLGYRGVAADMVWIRSVMYVGRRIIRKERRYDWMEKLYQVTTDLDPHWTRPYHAGAILLSALPQQDDRALALLKKGMANNGWNPDIPYGAAQLHLFRGRRKDSLRYFKLIDRTMRPSRSPGDQRPALTAEQRGLLKSVALIIPVLVKEEGNHRLAVSMAVRQLAATDDKVMRRVLANNYREVMARQMELELTGAAVHYRTMRGRRPKTLNEILELPAQTHGGRKYPAVRAHLVRRMTRTCNGDRELAEQIAAALPDDSLGMKFYLQERRDGIVHSQGLERLELRRLLLSLNPYVHRYTRQYRRAPTLSELDAYLRQQANTGQIPAAARTMLANGVPPCPLGPGGWSRIRTGADGLLEVPPGPSFPDMFSAPYPLPMGPKERARARR
jgi:hypothetical protein